MSLLVYHEARGEPYEGQLAVAQVLQNRVAQAWREGRTADYCTEAFRPEQFTGLNARRGAGEPQGAAWLRARNAAAAVLYENSFGLPEACRVATHFNRSQAKVQGSLHPVCRVGQHTFYTETRP